MTIQDKISSAKMNIVSKSGFYGHILLHMNFNSSDKIDTIGVNAKGDCFYNAQFMDNLNSERNSNEIVGTLLHEVMHIALMSFIRVGTRDKMIWNIATDIVINNLLVNDGYSLPKGGICPIRNEINLMGVKIRNIDKLSAEEVYSILEQKLSDTQKKVIEGFDEHDYSEELTEEEMESVERNMGKLISDAITMGRMKGDLPDSIDKLFGELFDPKISWKTKLRKYIRNEIPYDLSYCVDRNTIIKTPGGDKKITELKENELVYGLENDRLIETPVKNMFSKASDEKFIIRTKSGKRLICSGNHKILTKYGYIETKKLKKGDLIKTI